MKFSIVTCTWNSEPFLADSINSVLAQDWPDIEYLFVDGGSKDGTLERIGEIQRPHSVLKGVSGGISRAMNAGIKAATGDVIAHLHSDDYYLDGRVLSRVASALERSGAAWAVGRIMVDQGGVLIPESRPMPPYSYAGLVASRYFVPHPATFVRREAFKKVGLFDESLRYAMDCDLWLRLGQLGDPAVITVPLAAFREHTGSLSSANQLASRDEERRVRMRYWRNAPVSSVVYLARHWLRVRRLIRAGAVS
jgi:glycosyltransferase involved in cell wall biosynthesis